MYPSMRQSPAIRGQKVKAMALHPQCKAFLDAIAASGEKPLEQLSVAEASMMPRNLADFGGPEEPVAQVENRTIPGPVQPISVRIYRPTLADRLPALMFFHGGGFVLCDLDSHDLVVIAEWMRVRLCGVGDMHNGRHRSG
jgi:acetyl esterase/lipase